MTFPTLFPYGNGEPTNPAILGDVPLHQRLEQNILSSVVNLLTVNPFTALQAIPGSHTGH